MIKTLVVLFALSLTPNQAYLTQYKGYVVSAYDGDTVTVDLDLGLKVSLQGVKIRLYGIDAPEVRGASRPDGLKSRDAIRAMILGRSVIVETIRDKRGKYGRLLAVIWAKGEGKWCPKDQWCSVNDYMVQSGNAVYRSY